MVDINCKNGKLLLKFETHELGNKIIIRLKKNETDKKYIFEKIEDINQKELMFDDLGYVSYIDYIIFDDENNIIKNEEASIIQKIDVKLDIKTSKSEVHREHFNLKSENYEDNNLIIIDKNEKVYFDGVLLKNKIKQIFNEFIKDAVEFVYIQDPYFDYNFYKDLLENIPKNLNVKILHKRKQLNLPQNHNFELLHRPEIKKISDNIHDRFIISKHLGYQIGISLNGINKNKSFIMKINDVSLLISEFI